MHVNATVAFNIDCIDKHDNNNEDANKNDLDKGDQVFQVVNNFCDGKIFEDILTHSDDLPHFWFIEGQQESWGALKNACNNWSLLFYMLSFIYYCFII